MMAKGIKAIGSKPKPKRKGMGKLIGGKPFKALKFTIPKGRAIKYPTINPITIEPIRT